MVISDHTCTKTRVSVHCIVTGVLLDVWLFLLFGVRCKAVFVVVILELIRINVGRQGLAKAGYTALKVAWASIVSSSAWAEGLQHQRAS